MIRELSWSTLLWSGTGSPQSAEWYVTWVTGHEMWPTVSSGPNG